MSGRAKLNGKQEALLRWIADGCPEGIMPDDSHRISAAALRNRGLAVTSGRGPSWKARLTPAGWKYLEDLGYGQPAEAVALAEPLHAAAQDFQDRLERHEVSRQSLRRATALVQQLATTAESRGWEVVTATQSENEVGLVDWSSAKDGHLTVDVNEQRFWLRIQEEGVRTRGLLEDDEGASYDTGATGRLKVELRWGEWYTRQQTRWVDRPSEPLELRLEELIAEIEARANNGQRLGIARDARERRTADASRQEALAREREWTVHMAAARERYLEAQRAAALRAQAVAWQEATRIRAFCDALAAARGEDRTVADWVSWARAYADTLDPTRGAATVPTIVEPEPGALQPYLPDGWSASGA